MSIAIMQPYFFPYLGYVQLLDAVDVFIFYDDVNFIPRGFIHRNVIVVKGQKHRFTIPLIKASQNKAINQVHVAEKQTWLPKLLRTLELNYAKAPFYSQTMNLLHQSFAQLPCSVGRLAGESLRLLAAYLGLKTVFHYSSEMDISPDLGRADRLIQHCHSLKQTRYVNAIGGRELYKKETFAQHGVSLSFLEPKLNTYSAFGTPALPGLSTLDALMHCEPDFIAQKLLKGYTLL